MAKKYNHLHRLKKLTPKRQKSDAKLYKCMVPGCTYQVPVSFAENLIVQCSRCEQPMIMDKLAMDLVSPHCQGCPKVRNVKRVEELTMIDEFLKEKLG